MTAGSRSVHSRRRRKSSHLDRVSDFTHGQEYALAAVEDEDGVERTREGGVNITEPYDPTKTNIITRQQSIDALAKRIEYGEIDMDSAFQRQADLWGAERMSWLIESLLIRIPLPAFYFDGSNDDQWLVVDGLQRLATFRRFLVRKDLSLTGLEYLEVFNGCRFDQLPRDLRRRIEETQVTLHIIQAGTPAEVKFNIFRRINTLGLKLADQEIRHALNQGPATELLKELAESPEFRRATANSVKSERMMDREMVLRFLAFTMTPYQEYSDRDKFLTSHMEKINASQKRDIDKLRLAFKKAMEAAYEIFEEEAFRKSRYSSEPERTKPINKQLFETWSVVLGQCDADQLNVLRQRRDELICAFDEACDEDYDFFKSISVATADPSAVRKRFETIGNLVWEVLDE